MPDLVPLTLQVEHRLNELVQAGVRAITTAIDQMAVDLAQNRIPAEAPVGDTGALSSPWRRRQIDPLNVAVTPPSSRGNDAWYAHIVARGSRGSQPRSGRVLGIPDIGPRMSASGQTANPYHERAMAAVEQGANRMLADALAGEGIA